MAVEVGTVLETLLGARMCWETAITTDHNHVSLERHGGRELWVHRKGAMPAALGQSGVLPGSMGKVSIVGAGMKTHPGVAAKVFTTLGDNGINIEMISTSAIRISCVIAESELERAVVVLHDAFQLALPPT